MRDPRADFHAELDQVEALLQDEAQLCRHALTSVIGALTTRSVDVAREVIARDDEIDSLHVLIESTVESVLARQAPLAVDLRLALTMIHINLHLERIGDQCVNIAKLSLLIGEEPLSRELQWDFAAMGDQCEVMLETAMRAFGARDLAGAESLVAMDQVVNRANHGLGRRILQSGGDPEDGLRAIVIGRCLERIGDNAVDIGERCAYLITGQLREFTDASRAT